MNPKRLSATIIATLVAGVVVAAGAAAAKDPRALVLRQADIPGSQYEVDDGLDAYLRQPLKAAGLSGRAAIYSGATFSRAKGFLRVSGVVLTVSSPTEARKVFEIAGRARDRFTHRSNGGWTAMSLPVYGDQQRAFVDPPGSEGITNAELLVRKRAVVWLLHVTLDRRPKPPVSEIVTDLKRFATKERQRVGAG